MAFEVDAKVKVKSLSYEHTAKVIHNGGYRGMDGRHWIQVAVYTKCCKEPWEVHIEIEDLEEVQS